MGYYHQILEISENSSLKEIKQAYRRLAKLYHPDINKSENAHQKFIEISEAYEVLVKQADQPTIDPTPNTRNTSQEEYDEFIRLVREEARKQANMRYEKFARKHEAFRESGLSDVVLILKYFGRVAVPLLGLGMISLPIIVCVNEKSIQPFFFLFFFWVIGGFLLFDSFLKRKEYFKLGSFYYSFDKLKAFYLRTNDSATETCFYCNGRKANSRPYIVNFVKVKDVKLKNLGPLQHQAGYDRQNFEVKIPRSQKAFVIHSTTTTIKIVSILGSIFFFPSESLVWSFIGGAIIGFLISSSVLFITHTRSKNSYLLSYAMLIKIILWVTAIALCSKFDVKTFYINTNGYIRFVIFIMIFIDSIVEQILKFPDSRLFKPLLHRYDHLLPYFNKNYMLYLEIPGWTAIYPLIRWIF